MTKFTALDLSDRLLKTLADRGYETPTPIQAEAIPPVLDGRDLLGCAQTGTGKTAAFALPLIDRLLRARAKRRKLPRALILAPTRELAVQIDESLRTYGQGTGLRSVVIYGGVRQDRQVRQLKAGVDVVVATPGRLIDLMEQGFVDLSAVEILVLDEADHMLDMGFVEPIRQIAGQVPVERQTLFFSATMPPKIRSLADTMLRDPVSVSVAPVASTARLVDQTMYHVADEHKVTLLAHLLEDADLTRTVVFTRTKHGAEKLAKRLSRDGVRAGAIHGNKSQSQRQRGLDAFRNGRTRVLVATDVAARGLDVDGISHVINFNLPNEPEAYVHRIGRTGRAGASGQAISFCSRSERGFLRAIERLTGESIETKRAPEELNIPHDEPPKRSKPHGSKKPGGRPGKAKPRSKSHGGPKAEKRKRWKGSGSGKGRPAHGGPSKRGRGKFKAKAAN